MSTAQGSDAEVPTDEGVAALEETTVIDAGDVEKGKSEEGEVELFAIGDDEISLEEYETLKKGNMLHKTFTQKTQQLANDRKDFETNATSKAANTLQAHIKNLEELMADIDNVDVDDLTNSQFQALEKRRRKHEKAVSDAKTSLVFASRKTDTEIQQESASLVELMPHWIDDSGQYDQATANKDIALMIKTAKDFGVDLTLDPDYKLYAAFYEVAKYRELGSKADLTTKQTVKTSKASKPATKKTSAKKTREELYYG